MNGPLTGSVTLIPGGHTFSANYFQVSSVLQRVTHGLHSGLTWSAHLQLAPPGIIHDSLAPLRWHVASSSRSHNAVRMRARA